MLNFVKLFTVSLMCVTSGLLFSQPSPLRFELDVQKFDKVDEGTPVNLTYVFENSGPEPVFIQDTKVNCDCTTIEFPRAPIKPGEKDKLTVRFDTKGKIGFQERTVAIVTSAGTSEITFKGVVKASKATKQKYREDH